MSEINVVPYIDVMLVLLVIFMITAPLLSQGVKVELPKTQSQVLPPSDNEPVIINVDINGNYFINWGENETDPISLDGLLTRVTALRKYKPDIPVYIGGDVNVVYGKMVEVMVLLQNVGVTQIGLITEPPEQ